MTDILNLQMNWESFRQYVDSCMADSARNSDIDLAAHMSFVAGANSVMSCLRSNRTEERFDRMIDEVAMMRMEVQARIEQHNQGI